MKHITYEDLERLQPSGQYSWPHKTVKSAHHSYDTELGHHEEIELMLADGRTIILVAHIDGEVTRVSVIGPYVA